ncbi:MAG: DUF559 domain-containing protein [Cyanobacteria bacterium J06559_3]
MRACDRTGYPASLRLVIELDGSVHDSPEAQVRDAARTEVLAGD